MDYESFIDNKAYATVQLIAESQGTLPVNSGKALALAAIVAGAKTVPLR